MPQLFQPDRTVWMSIVRNMEDEQVRALDTRKLVAQDESPVVRGGRRKEDLDRVDRMTMLTPDVKQVNP